jgi:threonine synthase
LSIYDLKRVRQLVDRDEISRRKKGMWRWQELLPVLQIENQIFLGEGDTPLLSLPNLEKKLGLSNLYVKDESSNPTDSFKARGLAAAVSKAKELGVERVIIPTAGNAGGAMAAYAVQELVDFFLSKGADAYAKIRAGASLVQVYSALVFGGPALVNRIKRELAALLRADGFNRVSDAVGRGH